MASQQLAETEARLVAAYPVANEAYKSLGLARPLTPQSLLIRSSASAIPNSQLIQLTVTSQDPGFASRVANAMAQAAISQEQQRQASRYSTALNGLQQQLKSDRNEITTLRAKLAAAKGTSVSAAQIDGWNSQIKIDETAISNLQQRQFDLEATSAQSATTLLLPIPAQTPTSPVSPRPVRSAALAAFLALIAAAGLVLLFDRFSSTVRTPDEITQVLGGVPVLGAIRQMSSSDLRAGPVVATSPRSIVAEAYRMARTNMLYANVDTQSKVTLVTSARQSEGKSTTALNLAVSLAELGSRVLIIDADLRRPSVHRMLDLDNRVGLTSSVLSDGLRGQAIQPTQIANLHALCSGPLPPNPAELLSTQRMRRLLEKARELYDAVVVDSPPLLAVADPAVLSTMTDFVLLVVDVQTATRQQLGRARETLEQVGSRISGVLLNNLTQDRSSGYYYSYYYGYDYSYSQDDRRAGAAGESNGRADKRGLVQTTHTGERD
jgi:capsular exopolysaccharide synthesis family protein